MPRLLSKTILVSFISVVLLFVTLILLSLFSNDYDASDFSFGIILYAFVMAGLPIMGVSFLLLLGLNMFIDRKIKKNKPSYINRIYFTYGCGLTILVIAFFFLFDYSDRGRYFGNDGQPLNILAKYLPFGLLGIIIMLVNRKIVWRNFPVQEI
jgi:hypothetical protein